jgi:membrane peptidoglycan carboxypeptidase
VSNPDFAGSWQDPGAQARPDYRGPAAGAASGRPWSQDQPSHRQGRRGTRERGRGDSAVPPQRSGRHSGAHAQPGYDAGGYDGAGYGAGGYPPGPRSGGQDGWDYQSYAQGGYGSGAGTGTTAGYAAGGYSPTDAAGRTGLRERALDRTGLADPYHRGDTDLAGPAGPGGPGGPGGKPPRRKGSWWRRWTWKKALGVFASLVLVVILTVAGAIAWMYAHTPLPDDVAVAALQQSSTVYFSDGKTQIGTFSSGSNRQLLQSNQIPKILKDAVIAAEDRNYWTEGGISPTGIVRALYEDATGGEFQGGSTITQQFARNYYANIGTEQTYSRKLKEIFVAIKLSHTKSKDWILTQYLNTIFLGDNAYGVGAAAQTYFNKPAMKLNAAQSAMLAAMINQPGFFDPHPGTEGYEPLVARWHYVLGNMVRDGVLTQAQVDSMKFPKLKHSKQASGWTGFRGYIMQAVESEMQSRYGITKDQLYSRGLRITTTINLSMMKQLYKSVAEEKAAMAAGGRALPGYAHIGALLENPNTGAIIAWYGGPSYSMKPRACERVDCQFDMALNAREQVGSSFKPYVLATAVKQGMNAKTSVLNGYSPLWIPPDTEPMTFSSMTKPADSQGWYELNSPGENFGPINSAKAAALSSNQAFGDLIHRVGTRNTEQFAQQLGVNVQASGLSNMIGQAGMALGQGSLTVEEQASTYSTFANGGTVYTPHLIASFVESGTVHNAVVTQSRVLSKDEAGSVDWALLDDVIYGTGTKAALPDGRPIIAKTGTTNNAQSAFFIGAIPQYTLAVGIFTANQSDHTTQTLNNLGGGGDAAGFGGYWPALIWHNFAESEFTGLQIEQFPIPATFPGDKWVQVEKLPGKKHKKHKGHDPVFGPTPPPSGGPGPGPTPGPTCSFGFCNPSPSPSPTPTGPSPSPTPDPTCSFFCGGSPPPGGGGGGTGGAPAVVSRPSPAPRPSP